MKVFPQQTSVVSDTQQPQKKWKAFLCPECRLVFRLESGYQDKGVICKNCHYLLKVPTIRAASSAPSNQSESHPV